MRKVLILMCFAFIIVLSGCGCIKIRKDYPSYVCGDYIYEIKQNDDGKDVAYIIDFSEEGKEKEILVVPEYVDNLKVESFNYVDGWYQQTRGDMESDKLKKIFLPYEMEIAGHAFFHCSNLEYIIIMFDWNDANITSPAIIMYPYYLKTSLHWKCANVTYYDSIDYSTYWADHYEYGSAISFIPPNPAREGYEFVGWYKERECINKWIFEVDKLPEEKTYIEEGRERTLYQETRLFAKWTINN